MCICGSCQLTCVPQSSLGHCKKHIHLLQVMQPSKPRMQTLGERFTRVEALDFRRCEQLRNRNLAALASMSKLAVREICIGYLLEGTYVKPRITNKVCATFLAVPQR